jgi:dipeptidyl-peptidase 4
MPSRSIITRYPIIFCEFITLCMVLSGATCAQTDDASKSEKKLTVERIYSEPGLSGHMLRGMAWTPDGKQVTFLEAEKSDAEDATGGSAENNRNGKQKKENKAALWIVDAKSGDRRILVSAERLASMLPENSAAPTQATGLGRHSPADYQWAPDGKALLFQGPNALVWFGLKSEAPHTLVAGKETLAASLSASCGTIIFGW